MTESTGDIEPFKLKKVRVKKAAEIVAGQIRNAIVRGELPDGDTLPTEAVLIERFEVSRPTIREAIRILESENLLQVSRGARGGARIVSPATELVARILGQTLQARGETLGNLYQVRRLIEPPAARMAAEIRPKEAEEVLRKHIAYERRIKDDKAGTAGAITSFHRLIVEQSQNKTLALIIDALSEITEKHLTLVYRNRQADDSTLRLKRLEQGFRSHERLAELIGKGDGPGAEAHWHKHMANVESFWLDDVKESSIDVLE